MAVLTGLFRLGRDTELRYAQDTAVINLALAFDYGRKGQDGNRPTQWVEASLWGRQAEALAPYLLKGKQVVATIEDPHLEVYQTNNGERTKLTGRVLVIELAGGGQQQNQQQGQQTRQRQPHPQDQAARQPAPRQQQSRPQQQPAQQDYDSFDDDIPF